MAIDDDLAERVRLRCARLVPWDHEQLEALPADEARAVLAEALEADLRRIGDRRADAVIAAALRVGHQVYEATSSGDPDEQLEGEASAGFHEDRSVVAAEAKEAIQIALSRGDQFRRQEAAYMAAVRVAALREGA